MMAGVHASTSSKPLLESSDQGPFGIFARLRKRSLVVSETSGRVLARFGHFCRTLGSAAMEPPFRPPCAFVPVFITGLSRERGDPMNVPTL